jgi:hypothetical protein
MNMSNRRLAARAALSALVALALLPVGAQQPAPPTQTPAGQGRGGGRGASPYAEAARLPARIMEFAAAPDAIRPGGSVTLSWATENPGGVTIEPAIGRVGPRGTMRLTPARTTTYTLTVSGVGGPLTRTVTVTVEGTTAAPAASASSPRPVPRTADGKPDLSGVYDWTGGGGGRGRGAPPEPGGLPTTPTLKPGAEKFRVQRGPEDTGQYATCMPPGVPQTFSVPYAFQIVQTPSTVVILHEYLHLFRVIPIGVAHRPDPDPAWMGHSVGRWDGDTLVIDSIGFNDRTEVSGFRHTESLHVVERLRRVDYDTLSYEAVIEDPNVWTGPWVTRRTFPLSPGALKVEEFVCENNRDYRDLFGK